MKLEQELKQVDVARATGVNEMAIVSWERYTALPANTSFGNREPVPLSKAGSSGRCRRVPAQGLSCHKAYGVSSAEIKAKFQFALRPTDPNPDNLAEPPLTK